MKFKASLKYLVAKLHGCYPSAISVFGCFTLFATRASERGNEVVLIACLALPLRCLGLN